MDDDLIAGTINQMGDDFWGMVNYFKARIMEMRKYTWIFGLVILIAVGFGIRRARAQSYEMQSFTAVETTVTRGLSVVPNVDTGVIAVSDDGNLIARLKRSEFGNSSRVMTRWVLNTKQKTNTFVDHGAKMLVSYPWVERGVRNNKSGDHCDGTSAGQIEGFNVTLKQSTGNAGNGNSMDRKLWLAPKLGCFVIREERSEIDKDGKSVRLTVHTLTQIEVGEPDPSYFDTSLPEGYTQMMPEDYKGAVVNRINAQQ